jgi:beta-lactamase superfamily II metal-dependent hydrolase
MIFSLEALQAFNGDSLLLHGGTAQEPVLVLIDGGPTRTWGRSLKPRLEQLRAERAPGGALRIDHPQLSPNDDDHNGGIVAIGNALVSEQDESKPLSYDVQTLWFNSFDDVVGNSAEELRSAALDALEGPVGDPRADEIREAGRAVVASVPNGRTLRDQAEKLGWGHNDPFDGLVALPAAGARTIKLGGMSLTVVAPHAPELEHLAKAWETWLRKAREKADAAAAPAEFSDESPYNLSSIVVHAECDGKSMLLTGDARGDHVLSGLDQAGIAKDGATHVDILKLPHHGSLRNIDPTFFQRITADHYVISANGHDGNPDKETLDMIVASRADDDFEIHLTNDETDDDSQVELVQHVSAFLADQQASGRQFRVSARKDPALSLRIDLLEAS